MIHSSVMDLPLAVFLWSYFVTDTVQSTSPPSFLFLSKRYEFMNCWPWRCLSLLHGSEAQVKSIRVAFQKMKCAQSPTSWHRLLSGLNPGVLFLRCSVPLGKGLPLDHWTGERRWKIQMFSSVSSKRERERERHPLKTMKYADPERWRLFPDGYLGWRTHWKATSLLCKRQ